MTTQNNFSTLRSKVTLTTDKILLIYQLFGNGDFFVKCKTMNASYGDPCSFRIQNSTVHDGLDFAIAQNFHEVSYVDMQSMWELRNHFPTVAVAVNDLQALRICEQDGCAHGGWIPEKFLVPVGGPAPLLVLPVRCGVGRATEASCFGSCVGGMSRRMLEPAARNLNGDLASLLFVEVAGSCRPPSYHF